MSTPDLKKKGGTDVSEPKQGTREALKKNESASVDWAEKERIRFGGLGRKTESFHESIL